MDSIVVEGLLGAGGTILATLIGFALKVHNERIQRVESEQSSINKDISSISASLNKDLSNISKSLSEHMLESEKRYAKEDTMQYSLARIHDRLDQTAEKKDIESLRSDIKELLKHK